MIQKSSHNMSCNHVSFSHSFTERSTSRETFEYPQELLGPLFIRVLKLLLSVGPDVFYPNKKLCAEHLCYGRQVRSVTKYKWNISQN